MYIMRYELTYSTCKGGDQWWAMTYMELLQHLSLFVRKTVIAANLDSLKNGEHLLKY